jgi:hypothetical protein
MGPAGGVIVVDRAESFDPEWFDCGLKIGVFQSEIRTPKSEIEPSPVK